MGYINRKQVLLAGLKGDPGKDGAKGDSVFVRYSRFANGSNFSEKWEEGMTFIGIATGQTAPTSKDGYEWIELPSGSGSTDGGRAPRTFVFNDFATLYTFIDSYETVTCISPGSKTETVNASALQSGDVLRVLEDSVPDFLYFADEIYTMGADYKYDYNGTKYSLTVWAEYGLYKMGRLYPFQNGGADVDLSEYATKDELSEYATKDELSEYATKDELRKQVNAIIEETLLGGEW